MSTAPFPSTFAAPLRSTTMPADDTPELLLKPSVRRRGNREQGHALEMLGHAIEYLTDTRMFSVSDGAGRAKAEAEAAQILMRASRAVFEECAEVVSLSTKIGRKLRAMAPEWMQFLD